MPAAITFDYWRTLLWERGSDLRNGRVAAWKAFLDERDVPYEAGALQAAHEAAFAAASASWHEGVQFRAEHAAQQVLELLALGDVPEADAFFVESYSSAGAQTPLQAADGIEAVLRSLRAAGMRLGIVCDVGLTPSPVLRDHLERRGLLEYFDHWSFSDEVGHYKPSPEIFRHALSGLQVRDPAEAWHVGDLRRTDVAGAQGAGLVAVRYRGIYDDTSPGPEAEHVIADHAALLPLVGANADGKPAA